ncbi:hypothetical protein [Fundidesulfovibrio putealis]|uniref:hypothetical protein n=1 Tax=Fundidesulfovibrio putealis TaxID=270496 RepID=UPI0012EC9C25|nr:hypothetical protein [Fundidesulfovibrio putealis]
MRQVRNLQQGVQVVVFIVYSTDGQVLTPGDTIERQVDLEAEQNWTLAQIHYY